MIEDYRDEDEARYYGSDLNKFIHHHCTRQMDTINIDCLQYKASKAHLRLIEYKHSCEELSNSQKRLLPMMARCLKFMVRRKRFRFSVYVVYSDPPFTCAIIVNMLTKEKVIVRDIEIFKKWLNFEMELV